MYIVEPLRVAVLGNKEGTRNNEGLNKAMV
jgi:hypothetical protein